MMDNNVKYAIAFQAHHRPLWVVERGIILGFIGMAAAWANHPPADLPHPPSADSHEFLKRSLL
jgi:hypothetical protein